ncbi:uncharacterized protein LOC109790234, partial [Cajanus cajan]|uniref:uncharacterized protein LOC109790234 n=1 Tax=Cajanus cajan TaxID=3821 RepID=UPI0010FAEACB
NLKVEVFSTNKTNFSPQLNLPPPPESQFDSHPTHPPQSHSQPTHASQPDSQPSLASPFGFQPILSNELESNFDSEEEANENIEIQKSQPIARKRAWTVDVIDDQGTKNTKPLTVNDVWSLPSNERAVVEWNDEDQAIANSGALLNRFLGHLARDSDVFPISYTSWKKIPKDYKQNVLKDIIQAKFEVEHDLHVAYIFKSLNIKWREHRQELWQQRDDGTHNRDQLIAMVPEGLNKDQWASFVDYRLDSKTKSLAAKLVGEKYG